MLEFLNNFKIQQLLYQQKVPTDLIVYPKGLLTDIPDPIARAVPYYSEFWQIPDGRYVPKLRSATEAQALSLLIYGPDNVSGMSINDAVVSVIDPDFFSAYFNIDEEAGNLIWYDKTGRIVRVEYNDLAFWKSVLLGTNIAYSPAPTTAPQVSAQEEAKVWDRKTLTGGSADINPTAFLTNYLSLTKVDEKVPCLIGHTGIAKSAMVKAAAIANNMRLVDIRCGFIDKTDIQGYAHLIDNGKFAGTYEDAPMKELITATDEFLAASREFVANHEGATDLSSQDIKLLDLMRELSKTPLLFFDEINRAPKSVRNAFTTILSGKEFLEYKMHEVKMVAAANVPVNSQGATTEEMRNFYVINEIKDIAVLSRFTFLDIDPQSPDIQQNWISWASGSNPDNHRKISVDPIILEFVEKDPSVLYDMSSVIDKTDEEGTPVSASRLSDIKITTYRGWDQFASYFVKYIKPEKHGNEILIKNILGDTPSTDRFIEYLRNDKGYTVDDTFAKDDLSDTVEAGLDSGLPVLMAATTSVGKTARVKNYVKAKEGQKAKVLIEINLSVTDRIQLRGHPDKQPLGENIVPPHLKDSSLAGPLADFMSSQPNLPQAMTYFRPKKSIVEKLNYAKENDLDVVIFFDEVNRADPTVMSSVFEAVSDNRFSGVQFDRPDQIKVVCACNVGKPFKDVTRLDPAFTARFMMARKEEVDESDYNQFLSWADRIDDSTGEHNMDPSLVAAIKAGGFSGFQSMQDTLLGMQMKDNVATTRSLSSLSKLLSGSAYASSYMRGSLIDLDDQMTDAELIAEMENSKWVGNRPDSGVEMEKDGTTWTGKDILDTFLVDKDRYPVLMYQETINGQRGTLFKAHLGESQITEQILAFYNDAEKIGRFLTIPDLVDSSMAPQFFDQRVTKKDGSTGIGASIVSNELYEILTMHNTAYTPDDVLTVLTSAGESLSSANVQLVMLKELLDKPGAEDLFKTIDVTSIVPQLDNTYSHA